jgi:hypothetical protein
MKLSDLERPNDPSGRRSFMKMLAAAPLFATMGTRSFAATVTSTVKSKGKKKNYSNNIYTRLGVRPLINARGTWTYLTGSLELPEVREAILQASNYFVDFFELREATARQLARISGFESGMITSGAAAAIA